MKRGKTGRRRGLARWWPAAALTVGALLAVLLVGDTMSARQEEMDLRAPMAGSLRRVRFHSEVLNRDERLLIYLPPGYDLPANSGTRYPVVYLLHGCPGQERDWVVKGHAHRTLEGMILAGAVRPMIMVFPDLEGRRGVFDCNGVMNSADGSWRAEDSFLQDVVARTDDAYRTLADPGDRAVMGLSMGGFAAVNLAVRHPDVFSIACSMSGYFRARDFMPVALHVLGRRKDLWRANSPQDTIAGAADRSSLHIYLDCGDRDEYMPNNVAFAKRLRELGIDYRLKLTPGGHTYAFWGGQLTDCLLFADNRFGPAG